MTEPGRTAYEARFAGDRAWQAPAWSDTPADVRAIWAEVEEACRARRVLANRRPGIRFDIKHGGFDLNVMIGMPEPGEAAEVFVSGHRKIGTPLMASVRDAAIFTSLLLQGGYSLKMIAAALTREADGTPASPAGAVVDAMVEQIGDLA